MELIDYLALVVVWIMGAVYGWYARERQAKRIIERFVSQMAEMPPETSRVHITLEQRNGVFYAYNNETNEFMAQGSNRKDLESNLAKRYPEKFFAVDKESLKVLNESI